MAKNAFSAPFCHVTISHLLMTDLIFFLLSSIVPLITLLSELLCTSIHPIKGIVYSCDVILKLFSFRKAVNVGQTGDREHPLVCQKLFRVKLTLCYCSNYVISKRTENITEPQFSLAY